MRIKVNHIAAVIVRRPWFVLLLLVAAGCSGTHWTNPALPPGQAQIDERECRHSAEEDMGPLIYFPPGTQEYDSPMQMVDRSEQHQRFASLVADCMERKGYRRGDQQ